MHLEWPAADMTEACTARLSPVLPPPSTLDHCAYHKVKAVGQDGELPVLRASSRTPALGASCMACMSGDGMVGDVQFQTAPAPPKTCSVCSSLFSPSSRSPPLPPPALGSQMRGAKCIGLTWNAHARPFLVI